MQQENGYIAIASILVIAAVILMISTATALHSINDLQSARSTKQGQAALNLVEGCVEDALLRITKNLTLPTTISIPEGDCSATLNSQVGSNWTFTVNGTFDGSTKSIQVTAEKGSTTSITDWVEL